MDEERAAVFAAKWQRLIFGQAVVGRGSGVLVPLQGKLLRRNYFQAESPIRMLEAVLERWPGRAVTATLHPREGYTAEEH